ncbi:MAG: hypothetical protein EXS64_13635 [Candidatus Latescibacteria bacterium]|nr:hypothetical protein [Candidatus Latescibacterota bacterium]
MNRTLNKLTHLLIPALLTLLMFGSSPTTALGQVVEGAYRLPSDQIDQLLSLDGLPGLRVLIIDEDAPEKFSDAHSQSVKAWVERGGVVWAEGKGVETSLLSQIAPIVVKNYDYHKSGTGEKGGELVVRGGAPHLVISDHPLTEGVERLYVFPRRTFSGTRNALPILEMTDSKGNQGLVIASLSIGRGLVILDGTSRKQRRMFHKIPDFDGDHPNAVKQDGSWNSYDWPRLFENAKKAAELAYQP